MKKLISWLMVLMMAIFGFSAVSADTASAKWKGIVLDPANGVQQIADGVYVSTGAYLKVNIGLIVSGDEAVVIDSGWELAEAEAVKKYIEDNGLKLKYFLLTHWHDDHAINKDMFGGVEVFEPGNTSDGQIITLGNKTIKVVKTPGHLNDEHISFELVEQNIIFAGDVVVTCMPSAVYWGGNFKRLISTLQMLKTKNYSIIVPGHGDIMNSHAAIDRQIEYLKNVQKYVENQIKRGATYEDVMELEPGQTLEEADELKATVDQFIRNTEGFDPMWTGAIHFYTVYTAYMELTSEQ